MLEEFVTKISPGLGMHALMKKYMSAMNSQRRQPMLQKLF